MGINSPIFQSVLAFVKDKGPLPRDDSGAWKRISLDYLAPHTNQRRQSHLLDIWLPVGSFSTRQLRLKSNLEARRCGRERSANSAIGTFRLSTPLGTISSKLVR